MVAGVVAGAAVALNTTSAGATPVLPTRTGAQLISSVLSSTTTALSGTVQETADLGLPALPGGSGEASLSWQQLVTGTNTARVWVDGPERQRLAVQGQLSEADVVHDGQDVWTYTSHDDTVSHEVLPAHDAASDQTPAMTTPAAAAAKILAAVDPTTAVSVADSQTVAGRSAYTLVLQPRDARSTVREVSIAVDAATSVPLQLQVYGAATKPAFEVGFTSVSFTTPSSSVFAFTPPAGATVTTHPFGTDAQARSAHAGTGPTTPTTRAAATTRPTVLGTGWTSVVELPSGTDLSSSTSGLLGELTTSVGTSGAKLLHTALVNALILSDGRVFVGAVSPAVLEQTAANAPH